MPAQPPPKSAASSSRLSTGTDLVRRRHPEWAEHQNRWRWLLDSLEGGERYRQAVYGYDRRGVPVRNLIRHKREYPDPTGGNIGIPSSHGYGLGGPVGGDPAYPATDDDYELRRARTPVPTFVKEAVTDHLDRVFAREVDRDGPDALTAFWANVDGQGTPVDAWLHEIVGPILLAAGQIDIACDHPAAPEGEAVATQADVLRLGLSRCVASIVLPENLVWWKLAPDGNYIEALVREYPDGDDLTSPTGQPTALAAGSSDLNGSYLDRANYRHWTASESVLYDARGKELSRRPHSFGRVPIVRVFARKKPRCAHIGQSDYEGVAERQREFYNRDSELILSDTTQAHPLLQGPEDYIEADGTVPIGPSWLLPKKRSTSGGSTSYEGFDVVDFPKGGADSLRTNKHDIRDEVDRDAALNKPAGATGASTVAQSGISKSFDNARLNNKLCAVAKTLAGAEKRIAELALCVLNDGPIDPASLDAVEIAYSQQFDLADTSDLALTIGGILGIAALPAAGRLPEVTGEFLKTMVRQALPGRDDETYDEWDAEIEAALASVPEPTADPNADPNADAIEPAPGSPQAGPPTAQGGASGAKRLKDGSKPDSGSTTTLGDLEAAISLFDRANPDLKGMLDAKKS